ncbi:zinc finger protein 362-like isoform X4 [Hippocampus zosterae]|uniref:zinc finger protein 362-like isoform X4 n=1 Tax=Hippocampus zosterae TaxID=109293 RepID=UPI00223E3DE7|nr:zinc finger protein 362-like isoform X4 [Hippocampus zosterae]
MSIALQGRFLDQRDRGGNSRPGIMEDSHFNSSYFWSPIPTVPGQLENAVFLNKVKEQQEKSASFPPSSASHYQTTLLTIPTPGGKTDGGGHPPGTSHLHPPHSSQNITVLPVPSTGIMTAAGLVITTPQGTLVSPTSSQSFVSTHPTTMIVSAVHSQDKKEDGTPHVVVMPAPSKRGRKKKSMVGAGNETVILAQLSAGGQVTSLHHHTRDPYDVSNEDDEPGLKDSTKTYSNHTESKPHKCPHCTKSFANSSYLAQHLRIHTGVKPYTCSYCQKSFRQLSHLQQHNRIHTGDRPYKCTHAGCEKSFTQLSNLQSHRRQHNKDKPYKCSNCNKGYVDAASLEVHMSKHTVRHARIYSCGLCNRTYTSVRPICICEENSQWPQWCHTPASYFTPYSHMSAVSPLPSPQETYLVKHMEKHGQEQLNASDAVAAQQSQSQAARAQSGARGQAESSEGATSRAGHGQGGYGQPDAMPCPFDLHQYKTVSAGDIQYKPVGVSDIPSHKDLCLTVSSSSIQVEHLNS